MSFIVDRQTQDDLNLFGTGRKGSIFSLFNRTRTRGGAEVLKQIFSFPLSDTQRIEERSKAIAVLQRENVTFDFSGEWFDAAEFYLNQADERIFQVDSRKDLRQRLNSLVGGDSAMDAVIAGISGIRDIVVCLDRLIDTVGTVDYGFMGRLAELRSLPFFRYCIDVIPAGRVQSGRVAEYDEHLRRDGQRDIQTMLGAIYRLDCYIAVASVARQLGFTAAKVIDSSDNMIDIEGLYHPLVSGAVPNDLRVTARDNVVFLTGANMAGKSTFMKAFSLAVYLAHAGLPVPARAMTIALQEGLYTSINLADNINMGFSHFYAEVRRIRKVAECISRTPRVIIVFDELFRGTNVRDAFEATLAITRAFARHVQCTFMISTHIIEAGDELAGDNASVQFRYFPTVMEGSTPRYTYRLAEGITSDRQGMLIINNEHILEMLEEGRAGGRDRVENGRFLVDKQTLDDLRMLGRFRRDSVFSLFNLTRTRGGEILLDTWFNSPMTDAEAINSRSQVIAGFMELDLKFPFGGSMMAEIDNFLSEESHNGKFASATAVLRKKGLYCIGSQGEYEHTREMCEAMIRFLVDLDRFLPDNGPALIDGIRDILADQRLRELMSVTPLGLSTGQVMRCDYIIHCACHKLLGDLLDRLYELDAYLSVANVARERGFVFAKAMEPRPGVNIIDIRQVYHPALKWAVANDVVVDQDRNFIFLTGANMAGKSTFMKSFGIAVYLAHMGFPVPAASMEFTVQDGLYTSINVADNITQGFSYFYREVLRVKEVAEQVSAGKRLVVVFDELFKGTNVKDAYNGTLAISEAFGRYRSCTFLLSTHITEAADPLRDKVSGIRYIYLPTEMKDGRPVYTYKAAEGVSADRHGMLIIRKEGILDLL